MEGQLETSKLCARLLQVHQRVVHFLKSPTEKLCLHCQKQLWTKYQYAKCIVVFSDSGEKIKALEWIGQRKCDNLLSTALKRCIIALEKPHKLDLCFPLNLAVPSMSRSSSREVRIRVPFFMQSILVGNPPPKKGKRALLQDLPCPFSSRILICKEHAKPLGKWTVSEESDE